jgi:UDP-3-O-[3-hydroxymyristoyl] glucosamine N-acyltransferase
LTAGAWAALVGGELRGAASLTITGAESLDRAGPTDLTFIRSPKFAAAWPASRAGCALVSTGIVVPAFDQQHRAVIIVPDADRAMLTVLRALEKAQHNLGHAHAPGVHPSAIVSPDAHVDPTASIGPHVTLGPGAHVGPGSVLHAGVRLGARAKVGGHCVIHPNVCILDRCTMGDRCIVHPGVVIGADGFGYLPGPRGLEKIPHVGHVEIGNDVELGAGTCIDRGKFGATIIGDGAKIDNLVQIAHNCRIGRHVVICGCCGIAGSVIIGDQVLIGGMVGIADGVSIGKGARIAAHSGVMHDVPEGETFAGMPAVRQRDWARAQIAIKRLAERPGSEGTRAAGDASATSLSPQAS